MIIISGTGTVQVSRTAVAGNSNTTTNPPYYITVTVSAGVSECKLVQRMNVNSGLWSSTDNETVYLAGSLIAQGVGTASGIGMYYEESSGGAPVEIFTDSAATAEFNTYSGTSTAIPASTNTDTGDDGYIDIYISFSTSTTTRISSVQVVPTLNSGGGDQLQYDPNSSNREQALMGDYYIPRLSAKPIKSLLTGWDFPVNPAQVTESGNITTTAAYIWDQTITQKSAGTNVAFARNSVTGGLQLTTADASNSFYLLQYLSGKDAKKIVNGRWSVNVNGYKTSGAGDATVRVYLYRGSSAASVPTLGTTIGSVDTSGNFTLSAANWTLINRSGLGTAQGNLNLASTSPQINSLDNDLRFTGWEITDSSQISDTDKFAIVVTVAYTTNPTVIVMNSISLVPGDIPTRPAPLSIAESTFNCLRYYEKSFEPNVTPATAVGTNNVSWGVQGAVAGTLNTTAIIVRFRNAKRAIPNIALYNPVNNNAQVRNVGGTVDCTGSLSNPSIDGMLVTANMPGGTAQGLALAVHWVADARLGIV